MKRVLRSAAGAFAARSGLLSSCERAARGELSILCYHRILPGAQRARYHTPNLVVTPEAFQMHCRALAERYRVLPLAEAFDVWKNGAPQDRPLAVMTFDDGYRDNARYAAPILKASGLRATFYVIAGLVDRDELPWYDVVGNAHRGNGEQHPAGTAEAALERAKRLSPAEREALVAGLRVSVRPSDDDALIMTAAQVKSLADDGHEIGSHTMTHPMLPQCDDVELEREVVDSKAILSAVTGRSVSGLCFPNGDQDARVRRAAAAAGYAHAATMMPGLNDRQKDDVFALRRWFISEDGLSDASGEPSETLLRMEICGLSRRMFRRD